MEIDISFVQQAASRYFGISVDAMKGKSRKRPIVEARHTAMYLCKELIDHGVSLKMIGAAFGGRDHSTVVHAHKAIIDRMEVDPDFRKRVNGLRTLILGLQSP